ncbi:hypothetical protein BJY52DRAFT_1415982 [Lactarius psammicola]|nr:hypothetical protein BJY52DRAFT_1415982 [Lactarius psammicola]
MLTKKSKHLGATTADSQQTGHDIEASISALGSLASSELSVYLRTVDTGEGRGLPNETQNSESVEPGGPATNGAKTDIGKGEAQDKTEDPEEDEGSWDEMKQLRAKGNGLDSPTDAEDEKTSSKRKQPDQQDTHR